MLQCKIISGTDSMKVEQEVNSFLKSTSKIVIHSIHQAAAQEKLYITIFFSVRSRSAKMKEAAIEEVQVPLAGDALSQN